MTTVKDLLLHELTSMGFIYYPAMKRLMHKTETAGKSTVTVIQMDDDKKCQVFFSISDANVGLKDYTDSRMFGYDVETILGFLNRVSCMTTYANLHITAAA